jgi:hypothetical protein
VTCHPPHLIDIAQLVTDNLSQVNWLGGISPERCYHLDVELSAAGEQQGQVKIWPEAEAFVWSDRNELVNELTVGVACWARVEINDVSTQDQWAIEWLKIRDRLLAWQCPGYDLTRWDYPTGQFVDSDALRAGILASQVHFTYRKQG